MRNSRKTIIRVYLVLLHLVLIAEIVGWRCGLLVFGKDCSEIAYQRRYIECDSEQLLVGLEPVFGFDFPEHIRDVKAAKTIRFGWANLFIVKFTAEANTVEQFLKSFPETILESRSKPYYPCSDMRETVGSWPPPKWFTQPIQQGKHSEYGHGSLEIYIDTTDDKNSVVYMRGFSRKRI